MFSVTPAEPVVVRIALDVSALKGADNDKYLMLAIVEIVLCFFRTDSLWAPRDDALSTLQFVEQCRAALPDGAAALALSPQYLEPIGVLDAI
jgi:hypothetical protein